MVKENFVLALGVISVLFFSHISIAAVYSITQLTEPLAK